MANVKKFNLEECSLVNDLIADLREKYAMIIPRNLVIGLYRTFKRVYALMCKSAANKTTKKIVFLFKDANGEFVIGTILTFVPPADEEEDGGNWNLSMTYDLKDTEGADVVLDTFSDTFITIAQTEIFASLSAHCGNNSDMITICNEFERKVLQFLDANSNDSDDEVELIMEGVFTASVGLENGEKKYSIVPGYAVKQIIKNDDEAEQAIAKAAAFNRAMFPLHYIGDTKVTYALCTSSESINDMAARSMEQPIMLNGQLLFQGNILDPAVAGIRIDE